MYFLCYITIIKSCLASIIYLCVSLDIEKDVLVVHNLGKEAIFKLGYDEHGCKFWSELRRGQQQHILTPTTPPPPPPLKLRCKWKIFDTVNTVAFFKKGYLLCYITKIKSSFALINHYYVSLDVVKGVFIVHNPRKEVIFKLGYHEHGCTFWSELRTGQHLHILTPLSLNVRRKWINIWRS